MDIIVFTNLSMKKDLKKVHYEVDGKEMEKLFTAI